MERPLLYSRWELTGKTAVSRNAAGAQIKHGPLAEPVWQLDNKELASSQCLAELLCGLAIKDEVTDFLPSCCPQMPKRARKIRIWL